MPDFDSVTCRKCPYHEQQHLPERWRKSRKIVPLDTEARHSDTLLVFQAPGIEEWLVGAPVQPVMKQGGTTGRRVQLSWERKGKRRESYDITNAVQCFPGQDTDGADLDPAMLAVCACSNWLLETLQKGDYHTVITFGRVAGEVVSDLAQLEGFRFKFKRMRHPSRGMANDELDAVWE